MSVLHPPSVVGIVGGGQLGRMLAHAAQRFGYRTAVFTGGDEQTPASAVADIEIAAAFDDAGAVRRFVDCADVITWEFENVDLGVADIAAGAGIPVRPGRHVVAATADRGAEKRAIVDASAPVAPYQRSLRPWPPFPTELAATRSCLGTQRCQLRRPPSPRTGRGSAIVGPPARPLNRPGLVGGLL